MFSLLVGSKYKNITAERNLYFTIRLMIVRDELFQVGYEHNVAHILCENKVVSIKNMQLTNIFVVFGRSDEI